MSKNTGIRIEAVREINGKGEMGYRITKIQALTAEDLPSLYMDNDIATILGTGWTNPDVRLYLKNNGGNTFFSGRKYIFQTFYTCEDMKKINAHIKTAGEHLADVNAHLAKEREAWHGKVTFIDGVEQDQEKNTALSKQSIAERIAKLGGEGRLLYRNSRGHIKPLKPSTPLPSSHQAGLGKYHKSKIRRSKNHG